MNFAKNKEYIEFLENYINELHALFETATLLELRMVAKKGAKGKVEKYFSSEIKLDYPHLCNPRDMEEEKEKCGVFLLAIKNRLADLLTLVEKNKGLLK